MIDLAAVRTTLAAHKAKVLLLTCIDLRFHHEIAVVMKEHFHYDGQYDQMILPGASLGAQLTFGPDRKPHWQQTFLETLSLSIEVHDTDGLLIMDHMDCGAYKRYWPSMGAGDYTEAKEKDRHYHFMNSLATSIKHDLRHTKPSFFVLQWLLKKPPEGVSGLGDPSNWSFKLTE